MQLLAVNKYVLYGDTGRWQFQIILPSTPRSFNWSPPFSFQHLNIVSVFPLPYTCHTHRPSHQPLCDYPNNVWWAVQIMKLLIVQFSPFPCHLFPSPQHPHKTASRISVLQARLNPHTLESWLVHVTTRHQGQQIKDYETCDNFKEPPNAHKILVGSL